ncbi:DHH family phosphoesterase [Candidatus Leptofilum sp.]|uniref:DHH family phosphoesterase n=1 Tax=Candidatus Leptofilum sp. TaxID=3241576 RepID=UPI003B5A6743
MIDTWENIIEQLNKTKNALVCCHYQVDGDAYNSSVAAGMFLRGKGINFKIGCQDRLTTVIRNLNREFKFEQFNARVETVCDYDILIILDTAIVDQLGELEKVYHEALSNNIPIINIDHHEINPLFGNYNIVLPEAAATCEILFELFDNTLEIEPDLAQILLKGIIEDTDGLRTSNVTPKTLRTVASLMECGADQFALTKKTKSLNYFQAVAWGKILSKIKTTGKNRNIGYAVADASIVGPDAKYESNLVGVANFIRDRLQGIEVVAIFVERGDEVKVSFRSKPSVDVGAIAAQFGGGGHSTAAGCEFSNSSIAEVRNLILQAIELELER